jgi:hypothetical protein
VDSQNPAGMSITATCCKAYDFPTDDAVAIDYSEVCNSAPAGVTALSCTAMALLLSLVALFMHA